jgi:acyl-CoA synthetase (AMP-forming)/AMP-acid ligase II
VPPHHYGIYQTIRRNGLVLRDRPALVAGDTRLTYGDLWHAVDGVAAGLAAAGVTKGDRIAVLAFNGSEYVYLYGAAARLGAIVVPINWRLSASEVAYILADSTPKALCVASDLLSLVAEANTAAASLETVFVIGASVGDAEPFSELLRHPVVPIDVDIAPEDPFIILHTAAVAGHPRGAILSQRSVVASNLQLMHSWGLRMEDGNLCALPLFHFAGVATTLAVMHAGGVNILLPRFDADAALRSIREHAATILFEFPPMLSALLDRAKETGSDLASLRIVTGLDHPDTVRRLEATTGAVFWSCFGQTETGGLVTLSPFAERPGSAGLPGLLAEVRIIDEAGCALAPGNTGEIVVRGPMVFEGYWNRPHDTAYTFRGGWHHTGDLGAFDEDGFLWYRGRKADKALIKPGGENVYPAEVENALLAHPLVAEAAVIGIPDPQWGEAVKAVCVLRQSGEEVTSDALIEFVGHRIARYKKPKHVVFVESLPRRPDGSVDRERIKAEHGDA